jgi:hypothetical protein
MPVILTAFLAVPGSCPAVELGGTPLAGSDILRHLTESDNARQAALENYTAHRLYSAGNKTSGKSAEVDVAESWSTQAKKQLKVLSDRGSSLIVHRVLEKAIEAEMDSAQGANLDQARLIPANYSFQLDASESIDARDCYVFTVTPKIAAKYLIRGKIWVDKLDFAIIRVEGSPAKNPSFWTRKSHFVRRYEKHGQFWLPSSFDSDAELLVFGKSTLRIEYTNYRINNRD